MKNREEPRSRREFLWFARIRRCKKYGRKVRSIAFHETFSIPMLLCFSNVTDQGQSDHIDRAFTLIVIRNSRNGRGHRTNSRTTFRRKIWPHRKLSP